MQEDLLSKLISLLEHKIFVLGEMIGGQEAFSRYLKNPDWSRYADVTRPQEELLMKLRQVQSAQDYLMAELARAYGRARLANLKQLVRLVEPEWQRVLLELIAGVGQKVARLQELSKLNMALNQAEWRFNREWLGKGLNITPSTSLYNARGYASQTTYSHNCVSHQI